MKIAIKLAKKIEVTIEGSNKRVQYNSRPVVHQVQKNSDIAVRKWESNPSRVQPQKASNTAPLTNEQKKKLGLCFRCSEKWHLGHKCHNKTLHAIDGEGNEVEIEEEDMNPREMIETVIEEEENECDDREGEEQAMITICAHTNLQSQVAKTFKFRGYIGNIPVCALIDSGSTHSFIDPELTQTLQLRTTQTEPLSVNIANGTQMNSTQICKNLRFSLQKQEFHMDMRVMKVPGYDIILGIDWLATTDVMTVDWKKGVMQFNY